jgi:hypothetical protein
VQRPLDSDASQEFEDQLDRALVQILSGANRRPQLRDGGPVDKVPDPRVEQREPSFRLGQEASQELALGQLEFEPDREAVLALPTILF